MRNGKMVNNLGEEETMLNVNEIKMIYFSL